MVDLDLSQYLDPVKEKLSAWMYLLKGKLAPLLERLEVLPYYPYSVIGAAAAVAFLLLLLMLSRKRSAGPKPQKNKKGKADPNRPRPRASGTAVGLSSHEDFNYGGSGGYVAPNGAKTPTAVGRAIPEPVYAPQASVAPVTASASAVPAAAAHAVTPTDAAAYAVPEAALNQAPDIESVIKTCEEQFNSIYTEMSLQFGLVSDFDKFKTEVVKRIKDAEVTRRATVELKMTPQGLVLAHMAGVAGSILQSGLYHVGRGQMSMSGHEHLVVYRCALNTMRDNGFAGPDDVQNKLDFMEKKVLETGG